MSAYFSKLISSGEKLNIELDLSNYPTSADIKNAIRIDTSKFARQVDLESLKSSVDNLDIDKSKNLPTNLSNLKSKVDKLDVHKLVPVPVDLSELSDMVKNNVVKKYVYNAKINNIDHKIPDIANLATKATLNAKINEAKGETPSITNLATAAALNAEIYEINDKNRNIINSVSTTALTAVENKIPNVSNLAKKLTITQKLMKLKRKLLIMIIINILLLQNLINQQRKILLQI